MITKFVLRSTAALAIASLALTAPSAFANNHTKKSHAGMKHTAKKPVAGKAAVVPLKNIVETASATPDLSTLVAAVKAAGLVDTLASPGPFTVFAPTNAAFEKLPAGTVDTLLKPESKGALTSVLTYHVVAGKLTAANIIAAIKKGGGAAALTTVAGEKITARLEGGKVVITDAKGGKSTVTAANLMQSNGIVHVIDSVLLP